MPNKPQVLVIDYPLRWGGMVADAGLWRGVLGKELWDWGSKERLKLQAVKYGLKWRVIRHHRGGKTSIVESSN